MTPSAGRLGLTFAGRATVAFALASCLPALLFGGALGLLPALAAALLALSALGAWRNASGVEIDPPAPARVVAGERFDLVLTLRNRSRSPARDLVLFHGDHGRDRAVPAAYLPTLDGRTEERVRCRHRFVDRGHYREYRVTLRSGFPFGLFAMRRVFVLGADFLVLPRLGTISRIEERLPPKRGAAAELVRARPGTEEFWGLRQWREGESQNLIHWKSTARHGEPIVRELRGEERPAVHLMLDPHVRVHVPGRRNRAFEEAAAVTATLAEYFLKHRYRLRFSTLGEDNATIEFGRGRFGLFGLLDLLAKLQPEPGRRGIATPPAPARGETNVLVYSGGGRDAPSATGTDDLVTFDVDDRAIERHFQHLRVDEVLA